MLPHRQQKGWIREERRCETSAVSLLELMGRVSRRKCFDASTTRLRITATPMLGSNRTVMISFGNGNTAQGPFAAASEEFMRGLTVYDEVDMKYQQ
jgi:hypothetical protein